MIGQEDVVMRREGDQPPARLAQGDIAIRVAEIRCFRQIEKANARIAKRGGDVAGTVGAAVGYDQQFEVAIGLRQY